MLKRTFLLALFLISTISAKEKSNSWIRINQLGYLPNSIKTAVYISKGEKTPSQFLVYSAFTDELVLTSENLTSFGKYLNFKQSARLDFSEINSPGLYYLKIGEIRSPNFRIDNNIYSGTADYLLNYMRQQRCGYNPFLKDSCHTHDGFRIYHPQNDSLHIDVTGGWHDASDYLQYTTTSANAIYQMLFAYQQNPEVFGDKFDASGNPTKNGIPDILDEAKWGIDWLMKMNPSDNEFYNQIADDRDHMSFRLPTLDSVNYGKGLERPVYLCTGKPQGVLKYKNRADGLASTLGKFASTFALASDVLNKFYPQLSDKLLERAENAYRIGAENPGVCQTAPCRAPYFYEEDNYTDDMELAAAQLFLNTEDENYLKAASDFGEEEITTPWMGADTANHYQWYPFVNLGHYLIAENGGKYSREFVGYLKSGLEKIYNRGKNNPFQNGIPFIWCSNNLIAAALTQCRLYNELTGDNTFLEMETALRDWLFGCNPWGTSMIVGLPAWGDYPSDPHSALWNNNKFQTFGGLVDGPVYASIYNRLLGITLYDEDEYADFQNDYVVYHDDVGDYSTNEPTMDGTASLTYYLSAMEKIGDAEKLTDVETIEGAITRFDESSKNIYLVFTGDEFADGGTEIAKVLKTNNVKANFFFTGNFYRNKNFKKIIEQLIHDGNYLGAHSDKHLLYCDWTKRDSLLVSQKEFEKDLIDNYKEMKKFGIDPEDAKHFLPAYEWYNKQISYWTNGLGLSLINYSHGTLSNADYTIPSMKNYRSSAEIYNSIIEYEKNKGLNGFILLMHIGTHPQRQDKFYFKLEELINYLTKKGYDFKRL